MADKKDPVEAVAEVAYPEPDNRTEREREISGMKGERNAKQVTFQVPWPEGVSINGKEYRGIVQCSEGTRDYILQLCNARQRHEVLAIHGDGRQGLRMLDAMNANLTKY